jgi:hypothetical protein
VSPLSYYNGFRRAKDSKHSTTGKSKDVILTITQKLEVIRRLESRES